MRLVTHKNKQSGFTLLEVVIVLFLFSILLLGLFSLYDWHQKVFLLEQAEVRATGSVRSAFNEMTEYIAQGTTIIASRTVNGQNYSSGGNSIIIQIPSINSSNNYIPNTYDYVTYYLNGQKLYQVIETGSGSTRLAGTKQFGDVIETFSITYNNGTPSAASEVTITIGAKAPARPGSNVSTSASETIFLRNR